jgi:hypothetical protein
MTQRSLENVHIAWVQEIVPLEIHGQGQNCTIIYGRRNQQSGQFSEELHWWRCYRKHQVLVSYVD